MKPSFLDLIKKMIVTKPDERGLMGELLTHSFTQKGLLALGKKLMPLGGDFDQQAVSGAKMGR